jgi:putative transposase
VGLNFWARGYCVSTVGLDEAVILEYIRTQEERDNKEDQLQLGYLGTQWQARIAPF